MLSRIKKHTIVHKMPQDIRHHTFGISRIIYLIVLLTFIVVFLNFIFYPLYLLVGDGFVDSDSETLALEYESRIDDVFVENGDKVKKGQTLVRFDSSTFRQQLLRAISDYSDTATKRDALNTSVSKLNVMIDSTKKYLSFVEEAEKSLEKLQKEGLTSTDRLLSEKTRRFQAYRDLLTYQAELTSAQQSYQDLNALYAVSKEALHNLVKTFENGEKKASIDGIVGEINIKPGTVVKEAIPIAKVYYGKKFLTVFFESSYISCHEGDAVIVSFQNGSFAWGRIVDIGHYTTELPDEIKPRYRAPGRRLLARVLVKKELLEDQEIMDISKVYKPLGMNLIGAIYKDNLMEEYKTYLKEREDRQKISAQKHIDSNRYMDTIKNELV